MLTQKMLDAFNKQVNAELYSGYLYLSMNAYFESINLSGFAHWMRLQAAEELTHGMKMYDFINQRGGRAMLAAVDAPQSDWDSPLAAFEDALQHEQKVTGMINALVDTAIAESDHASNIFLQWFVTEQIEEEQNADAVVQKLKLMGDSKNGLFMIDRELAGRTDGTSTGADG